MPAVIPMVAAFAAAGGTVAGVGAALTGAAGFATFATVAGGIMSSVGMLTKNKTLTKLGSILGIAGAVTNIASSLAGTASEAASSTAGEIVADKAANEGVNEALKTTMTDSAVGEGLGNLGGAGAGSGGASAAGGGALTLDQPAGNLLEQYRSGLVDGSDYGLMSRNAVPEAFQQTQAGGIVTDGSDYGLTSRGLSTQSVVLDGQQNTALAQAGQQFKDKTALDSILDKLSNAGQWVRENKELVSAGGNLLGRGLQAYQQGEQFDEQMNLLEQRRRRLNQPVVLGGVQPLQLPMTKAGG